ncbi:hypothetical protein H2200_005730 [Cladophialophora chaetospira]|uniref:Zn(2)-C6 fungal-type domain-containing protein n=1 Tax=Cladophialophora chaetospira TaxID=386627 RepID=A0AA39CHW0_9EURO|nr:hypothetical protein H2200_005730 [Cladophialophora chaetospira]
MSLTSVIDIRVDSDESSSTAYPRHRKRKWHTKVATGCLKCKSRRIKCSEEKPQCHKCLKLGMPCPGYKVPVARIFELEPSPNPVFETDLEWSRHQYFVNVGSKILATFQLNSLLFWSRLAPQLGQRHAAVRHSLTALGALQAPLHSVPPDRLQPRPRYEISALAISQMQKSMHIIRTADPTSVPVEVFLTCCMLFLAQQFWIEKTSSAPTHVLAANRIVQESLSRGGSQLPKEFADIFIPSLNELINQLCTFSDGFPPPGSGLPVDHHLDFDVKQIGAVSDKTTAIDAIDRLLKCVIRATSGPRIPQTLKRKIPLAFEALDHKLQELHAADILPRDGYDWTHLHLHLLVARVMFYTLDSSNEAGLDDFLADFSLIVADCKKLVEMDIHNPPLKSLNTHLGVLPPLFFAATRCRQWGVRHEALQLLHDARVSERGWTSCIAFTIAKFVVDQEEDILNVLAEDYEADQVIRRIRLHSIKLSNDSHQAFVFTPEKFQGNPLALVSVHGNALSQKRKAQLAREFKYSETVFLHDAPGPGQPRLLEIFTETGEELPFAGHPIIGTAHYIFNFLEKINYDPASRDTQKQTTTLLTKAGRIPIFYNPYRGVAACAVPTNFHIHSKHVDIEKIITTQPQVQIVPTIDKERGRSFPLVSIVKGMTFVLVDLTDNPEIFGALQAGKSPEVELDPQWSPSFVGCMYYRVLAKSEAPGEPAIHNVQARMISHGIEDPGTGSACCALSCYLSLNAPSEKRPSDQTKKPTKASAAPSTGAEATGESDLVKKAEDLKLGETKTERKVFGIQQGAEMGRLCTIAVEVDVKNEADGKKSITNVVLSGRANMMLKGELIGN